MDQARRTTTPAARARLHSGSAANPEGIGTWKLLAHLGILHVTAVKLVLPWATIPMPPSQSMVSLATVSIQPMVALMGNSNLEREQTLLKPGLEETGSTRNV